MLSTALSDLPKVWDTAVEPITYADEISCESKIYHC